MISSKGKCQHNLETRQSRAAETLAARVMEALKLDVKVQVEV